MQFRVVIEEQIIERHIYLLDAVDTLAAAREASRLLLEGVLKPDEHTCHIEERDFTVMTPDKPVSMQGMLGSVHGHAVLAIYEDYDLTEEE
jgi:hypothetical protein